ncbi:MAG: DUF3558 domain-containing protein [Pseudonocardia sp.]
MTGSPARRAASGVAGSAARGVLVAAVAVVLASCAPAPVPGGAAPAAPPASPGPAVDPAAGAMPSIDERFTADIPAELKVRDPIDVRGLSPCELLTGAQLAEFGLDPTSARTNRARFGPGCSWDYREGLASAGIDLTTDPRAAKLPDLYRLRETSRNFEIRQIAGFPVIRDDIAEDECQLVLAVADTQIIGINAFSDRRRLPDQCGPAVRMAELIIANLRARN